ncbi:hypothetical protein [Echinicola salinicaeni]|uniref:hypothetical protein n=1 Tax=Echinicola salinicaeni TaxID=2762757 RepID=UPI001648FB38|nr:hypothetical protein [Echinicola salinicaeni]
MKTKLNWIMAVFCCFAISSVSIAQNDENPTKYYLNVSAEKDGVKENISKTYDSRATMEKDPFFKELKLDLPKGQHDKLVLETTIDDKKISLSTMKMNQKRLGISKHMAWVERDDDVDVEILREDGKQVRVIEKKVGYPNPNFHFDTESMEGGNAKIFSHNKKVEVFAFEKDENGQIKMDDSELDETIERLEDLIKELKAAKKNN